jgi:hypothetical protein
MTKKGLHILLSERRLNKLRLLAVEKDKTMTQIIEELIDNLPDPSAKKHGEFIHRWRYIPGLKTKL